MKSIWNWITGLRRLYDIKMEKCDKCVFWPMGCDMDGEARRGCKQADYKYFKQKGK